MLSILIYTLFSIIHLLWNIFIIIWNDVILILQSKHIGSINRGFIYSGNLILIQCVVGFGC